MSEVQQEQIQESQHEHHHEHHEHGSHHRQAILDEVGYKIHLHTSAVALRKQFRLVVTIPEPGPGTYWDKLLDGVRKAVEEYIASFYTGSSTLVETTSFKQKLYSAIEEYIQEKKITVSDETKGNIAYFVNEAADIYVTQISIPFFSTIANYIYKARSILNIVFISLSIVALVIAGIIFFTNEFKHRRFRYLFLGTTGAALTVLILPTVVLLSNKITKVNLVTRSLYTLFVNYFNGVFYSFYIWAGILVALSVVFMFLYVKHYRRVVH